MAEFLKTVARSSANLVPGRLSVHRDGYAFLIPDERTEAVAEAIDVDRASGVTPVAVVATAGTTLTGADTPAPAVGPVGRYLYEPDGAVIRAHLVAEVAAELGGHLVDETIAYVTADTLRPTPYATAYEITDVLPFNVKRLKALLRERGVGTAVIKKRGSAVEPDELRRKLRLEGPGSCVIILTRVAGAPTMLLGRPAAA